MKPKYKKGMDFSQIARTTPEFATGVPLALPNKAKRLRNAKPSPWKK